MGLSFAFTGAIFAWPYQAGVAAYVQEHGLVDDSSRVYGSSSGAVVAMMLACGIDIARVGTPAGLEANERALDGHRTPFFRPRGVIATYFAIFSRAMPDDAHRRASGRLFIVTRPLATWRPALVSKFPTRKALLDAIGASIAIPGFTVTLAYRHAEHGWCVDAGREVPEDDRPGVETVRVGVGPRSERDDISPSRPIPWNQKFLVASKKSRLELFELGWQDARRRFEAA